MKRLKKDDLNKIVDLIQMRLDDSDEPDIDDAHQLGVPISPSEFDHLVTAVVKSRQASVVTGLIGGKSRLPVGVGAPNLDPLLYARWALDIDVQLSTGVTPKMSNDMHIHASGESKDRWRAIGVQRHHVYAVDPRICHYGALISRLVRGLVPG